MPKTSCFWKNSESLVHEVIVSVWGFYRVVLGIQLVKVRARQQLSREEVLKNVRYLENAYSAIDEF